MDELRDNPVPPGLPSAGQKRPVAADADSIDPDAKRLRVSAFDHPPQILVSPPWPEPALPSPFYTLDSGTSSTSPALAHLGSTGSRSFAATSPIRDTTNAAAWQQPTWDYSWNLPSGSLETNARGTLQYGDSSFMAGSQDWFTNASRFMGNLEDWPLLALSGPGDAGIDLTQSPLGSAIHDQCPTANASITESVKGYQPSLSGCNQDTAITTPLCPESGKRLQNP